tara:strand:- start:123 stop:365 length:243 start_codon:yes stop_codon:yes gene_type:complete
MTSGFKEEVVVLTSNPRDKVVNFLNDLRQLLDKHNAKLYATDCELFMNNLGYVGMLEDNIETVEISDGSEIIYTSTIDNS